MHSWRSTSQSGNATEQLHSSYRSALIEHHSDHVKRLRWLIMDPAFLPFVKSRLCNVACLHHELAHKDAQLHRLCPCVCMYMDRAAKTLSLYLPLHRSYLLHETCAHHACLEGACLEDEPKCTQTFPWTNTKVHLRQCTKCSSAPGIHCMCR